MDLLECPLSEEGSILFLFVYVYDEGLAVLFLLIMNLIFSLISSNTVLQLT